MLEVHHGIGGITTRFVEQKGYKLELSGEKVVFDHQATRSIKMPIKTIPNAGLQRRLGIK